MMEAEERKEFVGPHRSFIFGYNRRDDDPSMSPTYYFVGHPGTILISTMSDRGKPRAVTLSPKVAMCVLDENWPPVYVQVYCDARIGATMESNPEQVIDSMMRLDETMAGKPMPESARSSAAPIAYQGRRQISSLR